MGDDRHKYRAFISYSHADEAWAQWLHRSLEGYRIPRRLIGRSTAAGVVGARLYPVFRDRDELPSSSQLATTIAEALQQSQSLIVVCSPHAANSRWVNEEVRIFKKLGRADQIFALLVAGEPGTDHECFPPALRFNVDAQGNVLDSEAEPVAADVRPGRDHRPVGLLKLVAGLLGIGYDELRQRERQKRYWERVRQVAIAAVVFALVAGAYHLDRQHRVEVARQEQLAHFVDLGREELLKDHKARAATFLSAALSGGLDTPALRILLGDAMPVVDAFTGVRVEPSPESPGVLAWLPDGRRFVTLWERAILWDTAGNKIRTFGDGSLSERMAVCVSDDGRYLLMEGRPSFTEQRTMIELYDIESGAQILRREGTATEGNAGPAFRSFSPDGKRVVIMDPKGGVSIFETASGALLRSLPDEGLSSASFDAKGERIVTADRRGGIAIWDVATGRRLMYRDTGLASRNLALFAPDGRLMVATDRGRLRVYDAKNGELSDAFSGHAAAIEILQYTADGRRLMTAGADGTRVWDVRTGDQLLFSPCTRCGFTARTGMSPDGERLVTRLDDTRMALWDIDQAISIQTLEGDPELTNSVLFGSDGRTLIAGYLGGVSIWDVGKLRSTLVRRLPHGGPLKTERVAETFSGRFSPDAKIVATSGSDGTARLWSAATGDPIRVLRGHEDMVYHLAFSPDGKLLATASDDQTARLWDVATGALRATLGGHNRFVRRVVFSPDGRVLLTVAGTEPALWDVATGNRLVVLKGHDAPAIEGMFSRDQKRVLTTSVDGHPRVFDATSGELLARLDGHEGVVPFAAFVDEDRMVISAGTDSTLRTWSSTNGQSLSSLKIDFAGAGGFRAGSLSHDQRRAMLSTSSGELVVWSWREGKSERLLGHTLTGYWNEFAADDTLGLSASNDGTAILWDIATRSALKVISAPWRTMNSWSASVDPALTRIVTTGASHPPSAEIWEVPHEKRSATEIAAILRCKSSWAIDGDRLVSREPSAADCAPYKR